MYRAFYDLHERPFELTSDPRFLFETPHHREALSTLQYGLSTAKAVTVLTGEAGTGKTTLLRAAFASEPCRQVTCVCIDNPALTRAEFIEVLARRFGLSAAAGASKAVLLAELEPRLLEAARRGESVALVIDEAQRLSDELLEEVRLLANIETPEKKLLPLVLAGQPEFAGRLNEPALRQLKQRVSLRCEIRPFILAETAAYIAHRIGVAGGDASQFFTREAIALIHERARGIPRTISVLCDNALLNGFAQACRPVNRVMVLEACRDFDLEGDHDTRSFADPEPADRGPAWLPASLAGSRPRAARLSLWRYVSRAWMSA